MPHAPPKIKVAVVGTGLAGLTAAHLLQTHPSQRFEPHIFEKADAIGMDSASVLLKLPVASSSSSPGGSDPPAPETQDLHVDVPMRSFQGGYYVRLRALYSALGIVPQARDFSYSFSYLSPAALAAATAAGPGKEGNGNANPNASEKPALRTKLLHNGANGTRGLGLPSELRLPAFAPKSLADPEELYKYARTTAYNLSAFLGTLLWLALLNAYVLVLSLPVLRPAPQVTLREWTDRWTPRGVVARWTGAGDRWEGFMHEIVVPMFSAVCTCATADVWAYPAEEILEYIYLTIGTHHYTVPGGSAQVIARLTACLPPAQVHVGCGVRALSRSWRTGLTDLVLLPDARADAADPAALRGFAHVVLATEAHYTAQLLEGLLFSDSDSDSDLGGKEGTGGGGAIRALRDCAAGVPQARAHVVTHTWPGVLPRDRADERDLNLIMFAAPSTSPASSSSERAAEADAEAEATAAKYAIMATHVVPLPRNTHASQAPIYQSTNPLPLASLSIPRAHILSQTTFLRAFVSAPSKAALEREMLRVKRTRWGGRAVVGVGRAQGTKGAWVVGSWCGGGIPLLEGCVRSAEVVVQAIGRQERERLERDAELDAGANKEGLALALEQEQDASPDARLAFPAQPRWAVRTRLHDQWRCVAELGRLYGCLAQDLVVLACYRLSTRRGHDELAVGL